MAGGAAPEDAGGNALETVLQKQEARHREEFELLEKHMAMKLKLLEEKITGGAGNSAVEHKISFDSGAGPIAVACASPGSSLADYSTGKTVNTIYNTTNATFNVAISVNVFGAEDTSHITHNAVWNMLKSIGLARTDTRKAAEMAILKMAMMIFSDKARPENLTCYLPNKRGANTLIHQEEGWEEVPLMMSMEPIATRAIEELFRKQPFPGVNGIPQDADIGDISKVLRYIIDHEKELVNGGLPVLKSIVIRNKELLAQAHKKLPAVGDA